jgi:hypothetical protein
VHADYVGGSGGTALTFRLVVTAGQLDLTGIALGGSIDTNGATIRDTAGNTAAPALNGVGSTAAVLIDGIGPTVIAVTRTDAAVQGDAARFTVVFSEPVAGVDAADFLITATGSVSGTVSAVTALDARTYVVTVSGVSGVGTLALAVAGAGTGIADPVGNALAGGYAGGESYALVAPVVPVVPAQPGFSGVAPYPEWPSDPPAPWLVYRSLPLGGRAYAPPFATAEFVLDAVRESIQLRGEQAEALTDAPSVDRAAQIRSASIGAGLGVDPRLFVLPAVAEVQALVESVQAPLTGLDAGEIGATSLFDDFSPFTGLAPNRPGGAPSPAVEVLFPGDRRSDASPARSHAADLALERAAAFLPRSVVVETAGNVPASAPSFTAQLKDAAAKMRAAPLPGASAVRKA